MKKRIVCICTCMVMLVFSACGEIKQEENNSVQENKGAIQETTKEEKNEQSEQKNTANIPFLSAGVEVDDNGRYPLIFDEIYFDQISFKAESDGNVFGLRMGAQALLAYVDEEKKDRTNDELLDDFIMEEAKMFFAEHLEDANTIASYNIVSQEDVTVGEFDCTHYIIKLAGSYPDYPETWDYSFEAYCYHFNDYPMVMAGVVRNPDRYEENDKELIETARKDISNNLVRMVSSVSSEKK